MASTNGLQNNALIVNTIDGLQTIYATSIYDNGVLLTPGNYVPYTGATQGVNLGGQQLQTSYVPNVGSDVCNKAYVDAGTGGTIGYVQQYFVPYNGANSDTDLGSKNIKTTHVPTGTNDLTNKNYVDAGLGTKVPYTGAVYDLNLGSQNLSAAVITGTQFLLSGTAPTPARVAGYDTTGLYYLTTPATYLTNLTSDPQTQINAKFNSSGGTISGNVSLTGTNNITQAYNALTSDTTTLVNRQTMDSAIAGLGAGILNLNNTWTGTNTFNNTVSLTSVATAAASYTLGLNTSNQIVKYVPPTWIGGSITTGYIPYASAANTLADSLLYKSGNNTGIGTTSPAGRFTIYATSAADADRLTSLVINTYRAGIRLTSNATAGCDWNMYVEAAGGSPPQDALCFYNQGTSQFRMVITRDGNVGIGTENPTGKLTVSSTTADYTNSLVVNTAWPSITLDGTGTTGRKWSILNGGTGAGVGQGNFGIFDITGSAYRLSINSSGNVGIGVDTPTYKLQVAGTGLFGYIAGSKKGIFIANEDSYGTTPCIQGVSSGLGTNSISLNPGGGNIGLGRITADLCRVESQTSTLTAYSSFYITPGPATTFFPVVFNTNAAHDTGQNTWKITVARTSVHQDATWRGSLMAEFWGNSSVWGNGADSFSYQIAGTTSGATYNYFVGNAAVDFTSGWLVVYLRGGTTYQYSCKGASLYYYPSSSPFVSYTIPAGNNTVLYATNTPTAPFTNTYLQYDSFTGLSTYTSANSGTVLSPLINRVGGGVRLSLIPTNGDPEYGFASYQTSGNAGGATYVNAISNTPVTDYNPGTWSAKGYTLFTPTLDPGPNRCGLGIGSAGNGAAGVYGDNYITSLTPGIIWTNLWISAHQTLIRYDGTLVAYSVAGGWVSVSDEREKEDIKDLKTTRSLQRILACRPKFYKRKIYEKEDGTPVSQSTKEAVHIGLLAQDVLQHNPHCVSTWENTQTDDEDKSRYGINYGDYTIHLIGAVQEQQKQIDAQAKQITNLQEQLSALATQFSAYISAVHGPSQTSRS